MASKSIDKCVSSLTTLLQEACADSRCPSGNKRVRCDPWWTPKLTDLRRGVAASRRRFQRCNLPTENEEHHSGALGPNKAPISARRSRGQRGHLGEGSSQRFHLRNYACDSCLISVDVKSAFNNIWWPMVLSELGRARSPRNLLMLFKDYLPERKVVYLTPSVRYERNYWKGCS